MSVEHYIMNETVWVGGNYGEWTDRTQGGSATIVQSTASAYPTARGRYGLHLDQGSADVAYVEKTLGTIAIPAGGSIYIGLYMKFIANTSIVGGIYPLRALLTADWNDLKIYIRGDGDATNKRKIILASVDDDGAAVSMGYVATLTLGDWVYIVCRIQRASASGVSDGRVDLYLDGTLVGSVTSVKNFTRAATATTLYLGETHVSDGAEYYFDEIKATLDEYPVAYVAPPIGSMGFLGVGRM